MRKIGLFGGTFDPIHLGHLNLAISLKEKEGLDRILFCPAQVSPLKTHALPPVDPEHRVAMIDLAIAPFPFLQLITIELERDGPSYTLDTLKQLQEQFPAHYYLLLGQDSLSTFSAWKGAEEILSLATPLIGIRSGSPYPPFSGLSTEAIHYLEKGIVEIPMMDISSTTLRHRLKEGLPSAHLLPQTVSDYIHKHRLYL